jgi:hypothetical protein
MNDPRRRLRTKARPALLWTLFFFFLGHIVAGVYLHRRHPEFFDAEVALRLHKLPARMAEAPGRPLALALGSSRLVFGLRPTSAMEQGNDGTDGTLLFNFSVLGAGLVGQRMMLQRLLRMLRGELTAYLRRLSVENQTPILDARTWQADEDLPDYCHLSPAGARAFSACFGREVLRPLLQGRPLAKNVLLSGSEQP